MQKKVLYINTKDYVTSVFEDFLEIHGDRICGDDPAMYCGIAKLNGIALTIIGQMNGHSIEDRVKYNFSMNMPEGFRKALRLMKQAEKFKRPIVCFVDTIGAYPGIYAETHGQISAIAMNLFETIDIRVPIISVLIGEGGSGGALALCISDRLCAFSNAKLSVVSENAFVEILRKDTDKLNVASACLRTEPIELKNKNIVDNIIYVDSHNSTIEQTAAKLKRYLINELMQLCSKDINELLQARRLKYQLIG